MFLWIMQRPGHRSYHGTGVGVAQVQPGPSDSAVYPSPAPGLTRCYKMEVLFLLSLECVPSICPYPAAASGRPETEETALDLLKMPVSF